MLQTAKTTSHKKNPTPVLNNMYFIRVRWR